METKIQIDLEHKNCSVEMRLNDIPIRKYDAKEQPFVSVAAGYYLVDNVNTLELIINPGPTPSQARTGNTEMPQDEIYAALKLVAYPLGVYPGDPSGKILAKIEYTGLAGQNDTFPKVLMYRVDLGKQHGRWAWQDGADIKLDNDTKKEIMSLLNVLHDAFVKGDGQKVLDLAKLRLDDGARANSAVDRNKQHQLFINDIKRYESYPDWGMEPLSPLEAEFRIVANGKMVECIRHDWQPLLVSTPLKKRDGGRYDYRVFLSKIKGKLHIVR